MKRIALLSDTHGYLPQIAGVDAVIHAGDIGVDRDPIHWFTTQLYPWARTTQVPIFATFGNHDRIGERRAVPLGCPPNLELMVDELRMVFDVAVWFSPWSNRFGDWAYMATDETLRKKYALIPGITEVLVTHGPPFGAADQAAGSNRCGSQALRDRIVTGLPNLKLVVTGHIHEAHGEAIIKTDDGRNVRVLNVSHVNEWYEPVHEPTIIKWP